MDTQVARLNKTLTVTLEKQHVIVVCYLALTRKIHIHVHAFQKEISLLCSGAFKHTYTVSTVCHLEELLNLRRCLARWSCTGMSFITIERLQEARG
jgi:hypothetical protein